ncbi:MAG: hypothetical protein SFV52_15755 [Saprospiraceae bacterium]|nr:hypothetical protein [Saprospiraceae bacterium]
MILNFYSIIMHQLIKTTLVLSCCFLACGPAPQPKPLEKVDYYGNGAVSRRVIILDGKKEGMMTDYYPDGKVMGERWFEQDKQHGKTVLYYPSGTVKEVQYYVRGLKQGGDTVFYENGAIQFVSHFENGLKNGFLLKWDSLGRKVFEAEYVLDTLVAVNGERR